MQTAMRRTIRSIAAALSFVLILNPIAYAYANNTQVSSSSTQANTSPSYAPGPAQIAQAHKIFLSNTGTDPYFPIDDTQAYSQVFAALQSWGHYQFVASPADADLIFQLHEVASVNDYAGYHDRVYTFTDLSFQLTIIDPKTNTTLWIITSPANVRGGARARARWISIAVTNLVSRIKVLAGEPLSPTETTELTTVPQHHYARNAWIGVGAGVGIAVAGGLILHHVFDNAVANQKKSQDSFCIANNIPLNECAGG